MTSLVRDAYDRYNRSKNKGKNKSKDKDEEEKKVIKYCCGKKMDEVESAHLDIKVFVCKKCGRIENEED